MVRCVTADPVLTMRVAIDGLDDSDDQELDELTDHLRDDLLDTDVDGVDYVDGEAPEGTRAVDPALIGTLLVTLGPAVVLQVGRVLQTWLKHRPVRRIRITLGDRELVIDHASRDVEQALAQAIAERPADG